MAQINPRTFADAIALGDNIYELILTNWGNRGRAQDPNNGSLRYPPIPSIPFTASNVILGGSIPLESGQSTPPVMDTLPPLQSLTAMAISPRSMVDRCIVHFSGLPNVPAQDTDPLPYPYGPFDTASGKVITVEEGFVNYGGILETEQFLAVGAPLIGQLPGPISIRAHPYAWFQDDYFAVDPAGTDTFGTALNTLSNTTGPGFFTPPELRILLYFNGRAALPPMKRAPFQISTDLLALYPFAGAIPPVVVPIMGRRRVTITSRNTNGFPVTLYVRGAYNENWSGPLSTTNTSTIEADLTAPVVVAANGSAVVDLDHPGVPFLTLMANGGLGGLSINVAAFD